MKMFYIIGSAVLASGATVALGMCLFECAIKHNKKRRYAAIKGLELGDAIIIKNEPFKRAFFKRIVSPSCMEVTPIFDNTHSELVSRAYIHPSHFIKKESNGINLVKFRR